MLYLVATPIGNLKDITLRSLEVLQQVDAVICEDTRRTGLLLNHYNIKKSLITLNDFSETRMLPKIIQELQLGKTYALVSDAGTPLISDPGYKLVRECSLNNIKIDSLPGPTAAITALTLSALPPDKFFFIGYLPEKSGKRVAMLKDLLEINKILKTTFIIYVAPHKLVTTMKDIHLTLGDIEVVLAHELTKTFQFVEKKLTSLWLETFQKKNPKGEYVLLLSLG